MTIYHSCQFCPLSKFLGIHVSVHRYHHFVRSYSISGQHVVRKSSFVVSSSERPRGLSKNVDKKSASGWLDKWKETREWNPPKTPPPALNYRSQETVLNSFSTRSNSSGSSSTMDRIVEKLKRFGYMDDDNDSDDGRGIVIEKGSVEDIFYVEEGMLPNTRGGFSRNSPLGIEPVFKSGEEVRFPWEKPDEKTEEPGNTVKHKSRNYMAELTLPESELRRLKVLTLKTKSKVRIKGTGVTQETVDAIH